MRYVVVSLLIIVFHGFYENGWASCAHSDDKEVNKGIVAPLRPILIFDFGGVIGGADRGVVANAIAPVLNIPVQEALGVLAELRVAKRQGISTASFWRVYEARSEQQLPYNWDEYWEEVQRHAIRSTPGMVDLVEDLRAKGYRVAMLSNTTGRRAEFIRRQGLYSHFDPVLLSCEIGVKKPDRAAYERLLHELEASAYECLFIDDKPENIEAARCLGIDGIVFTTIEALEQELAKRGIHHMPKG